MVAVPEATPVTRPVVTSTVAIPVALLLQVPPERVLPRVVVKPWQTVVVPVIAEGAGSAFTVSDCCAEVVPPHPPVTV